MDSVRKNLLPGITEFRLDYPEERHVVVRVSPLFIKETNCRVLLPYSMTSHNSKN